MAYSIDSLSNSKGGYSQQDTKHNNTMLIFDAIRKSGKVSRVALSSLTGLSTSTVSELVEDLIEKEYVKEVGSEETNTRGRKPISLVINPDGGYIVVCEIINTGYNCFLCDLSCRIIASFPYRVVSQKNTTRDVCDVMDTFLEENKVNSEKLIGILIDYPGVCDSVNQRIIYSTVVQSERYLGNKNIHDLCDKYPNACVSVCNDSSLAAYSSFKLSGNHFNEVLLYLNMFECVGGGAIIANDKGENIYCFPIEIGQIQIVVDETNNQYESKTFEQMVNAIEIFRRVNKEVGMHLDYSEEYMSEKNSDLMKYLGKELQKGNKKLEMVIHDIALQTAIAISNVCYIVDPSDIFIGGMVRHLGEKFIEMIEREIQNMHLIPSPAVRRLHISNLDHRLKIQGGANMIVDAVFAIV